jgi:hypothetical protein
MLESIESVESLVNSSIDYIISNGLILKSTQSNTNSSLNHCPFTLFPTDFLKENFQLALEIHPLLNILYNEISKDYDFLSEVIQE